MFLQYENPLWDQPLSFLHAVIPMESTDISGNRAGKFHPLSYTKVHVHA